MADFEARSRLSSILSALEHEGEGLRRLEDAGLEHVLRTLDVLRAEIVALLAALDDESPQNGGSP